MTPEEKKATEKLTESAESHSEPTVAPCTPEADKEPQNILQITEDGQLVMSLDLSKSSFPFCLGFVVMASDGIKQWFAMRDMKKQRIVRPGDGVLQGIKKAPGMLKKLFRA